MASIITGCIRRGWFLLYSLFYYITHLKRFKFSLELNKLITNFNDLENWWRIFLWKYPFWFNLVSFCIVLLWMSEPIVLLSIMRDFRWKVLLSLVEVCSGGGLPESVVSFIIFSIQWSTRYLICCWQLLSQLYMQISLLELLILKLCVRIMGHHHSE